MRYRLGEVCMRRKLSLLISSSFFFYLKNIQIKRKNNIKIKMIPKAKYWKKNFTIEKKQNLF